MATSSVPFMFCLSRTVSLLTSVFEVNKYCQRDLFLVVGFLHFGKKIYKNVKMEEGSSTTKRSGSGNYCCVSSCKNTRYKVDNKAKIKRGINFFFKNSKKKKGLASKHIQIFAKRKEITHSYVNFTLTQVTKIYSWDRVKKDSNVMWIPNSKT